MTILQILKNILTLCCAVSLVSNSVFLAEAPSSLLNKTKIIRFGEKSDFPFIFMFSISQHLTVYAALKSHEPELIKCNKTANFAWSGLENLLLPIKVINLPHQITLRSAICSSHHGSKPLITVVSCAELYCAVLNKPADLSVWRRYQIKKLAESLLWHFPGHLEANSSVTPWCTTRSEGAIRSKLSMVWELSKPSKKEKWGNLLKSARFWCL